MRKTLTILTAIVLMAITLCGCGTQKEVMLYPEKTASVVVHPNDLDKGTTYIHIWEVG